MSEIRERAQRRIDRWDDTAEAAKAVGLGALWPEDTTECYAIITDLLAELDRVEKWKEAVIASHDNYKDALEKIARGVLEPGHVYEQAVMMQDIAIKVLQEEHGCTVMGAKVCFACGECDPLTTADLACGGKV